MNSHSSPSARLARAENNGRRGNDRSSFLPPPPVYCATIEIEERLRLEQIASELLREEPHLNRTDNFGSLVTTGLSEGPALFFEDHRAIALFTGDSPLEYRMLCFAGDRDFVAIGGRPNRFFESYCRDLLGLGRPRVLHLNGDEREAVQSISERIFSDNKAYRAVIDAARASGRWSIVPYMASGDAWTLAGRLAQTADVAVTVAGPPPQLTRRINDKLWFTELVTKVLGIEAHPSTYSAYGFAALAGRVRSLSRAYDKIIVKVPESAGSFGNVLIEAVQLGTMSIRELQRFLWSLLASTGWRGLFPILVSVWDQPIIASPSVQVWIPDGANMSYSDGVFTQATVGQQGRFIGASPANLPQSTLRTLTQEALRLAFVLQHLGYFGRCSFDAVIVGENYDKPRIHWIECNGRWGGVSIPLTLAHRFVSQSSNLVPSFAQLTELQMPPRDFEAVLRLLDPLLYSQQKQSGIVILTPTRLTEGTGANIMALATSKGESEGLLNEALSMLLKSN